MRFICWKVFAAVRCLIFITFSILFIICCNNIIYMVFFMMKLAVSFFQGGFRVIKTISRSTKRTFAWLGIHTHISNRKSLFRLHFVVHVDTHMCSLFLSDAVSFSILDRLFFFVFFPPISPQREHYLYLYLHLWHFTPLR